jgi:hypothetical protein
MRMHLVKLDQHHVCWLCCVRLLDAASGANACVGNVAVSVESTVGSQAMYVINLACLRSDSWHLLALSGLTLCHLAGLRSAHALRQCINLAEVQDMTCTLGKVASVVRAAHLVHNVCCITPPFVQQSFYLVLILLIVPCHKIFSRIEFVVPLLPPAAGMHVKRKMSTPVGACTLRLCP